MRPVRPAGGVGGRARERGRKTLRGTPREDPPQALGHRERHMSCSQGSDGELRRKGDFLRHDGNSERETSAERDEAARTADTHGRAAFSVYASRDGRYASRDSVYG
ncbi:hypothetical protein T484DRAFT_1910444, partial [Baffinella frigidus]